MSHFYGTLVGFRGTATRRSTESAGLLSTAATHDYRVETQLSHESGVDYLCITVVPLNGGPVRLLYKGPLANAGATYL